MIQRIILSLVFALSSLPLLAQYNFTELGFHLGGGAAIPVFGKDFSAGGGYNVGGFFTHFRCGKRDGYHFELGFRGFTLTEKRTAAPSLYDEFTAGKFNYHFGYVELGAYYKIRATKHNTLKEVAFMIGPKANFRVFSQVSANGGPTEHLGKTDYRSVFPVIPGIHVGLWARRMIDKFHYLFIIPGFEWYLFPHANTHSDNGFESRKFSSFYVFLNVGFSFRMKQTF